MKAIVVRENGGPEKLVLEDVAEPYPGSDEVVVDVESAGVNFIDTYQRNGLYPLEFPFTPGLEGAGTVSDLGSDVAGISIGDRVGWVNSLGSYAGKCRVPVTGLIPVPEGMDFDTTAAVLLQGITAHYLATDTFALHEGSKCLIHAGAGGVGLLLTQIARMKGAHVVTTVGRTEKAALSRDAGADQVIVYTDIDFQQAIERSLGPNSLDVVFDGVGADTFARGLDLLSPRGMMVTFGNASGPVPEIAPLLLAQKGSLFLTRPTMAHYIRTRDELLARANDLFDWIKSGSLRVHIGAEYPLEQAADAHGALEGRKTTGKLLLHP